MPKTDVELYKRLYTFDADKLLKNWQLPKTRQLKKKTKLPKIKRIGMKGASKLTPSNSKVSKPPKTVKNNADIDRIIKKLFQKKNKLRFNFKSFYQIFFILN